MPVGKDWPDWLLKGHALLKKSVVVVGDDNHQHKGKIVKFALEGRHPFNDGIGLIFHAELCNGSTANLSLRDAQDGVKLFQTVDRMDRQSGRRTWCPDVLS